MNKSLSYIYLLMVAVLLGTATSSCHRKPTPGDSYDIKVMKPSPRDTVHTEEARPIPEFHSVFIYDADTIHVKISPEYAIDVTGPHSYVKSHQSVVRNTNLYVKYDNRDTHYRRTSVHVSLPVLNCLQIRGCNVLIVDGADVDSHNMLVDLQNVEKIRFASPLHAMSIRLMLADCGPAHFSAYCRDFIASFQNSPGVSISGKVASLRFDGGKREDADISRLTAGQIINK
jgi:hypothetical protein